MEEKSTRLSKNKKGYGYKYTDLAQIHEYLESIDYSYYQYIDRIESDDYIMTVPIMNGKEQSARRGVKLVDAVLNGVKNPAQEQGSAITYARRYSLLMAFGLATEDDDAQSLSKPKGKATKPETAKAKIDYKTALIDELKRLEININEYAKEHQLSPKTTQEEAKALLEQLKKGEA